MSTNYTHVGLIYCSNQFSTNPFCPCKLTQSIISFLLLAAIIYDMVMRFKQQRHCISIFYPLFWPMSIALACSIGFCFDRSIYQFSYLAQFFYSVYFSLIVYYVALKLSGVMQLKKILIVVVHGLLILTLLFHAAILVIRFTNSYNRCEEFWFMIGDSYTLILEIVLMVTGVSYTRKQKQKLEGIENPLNYKNPLPNIWVWISVNILANLIQFVSSLFFELTPMLNCSFSDNYTMDQCAKLVVKFLTFHMGMVSTLIFFRGRVQRKIEGLSPRPSTEYSNSVELNPVSIYN